MIRRAFALGSEDWASASPSELVGSHGEENVLTCYQTEGDAGSSEEFVFQAKFGSSFVPLQKSIHLFQPYFP